MMMLLNNAHWDMPVTENPALNSVEIWNFLNFTDDSHPIHLHLVRFQILDRRGFEPYLLLHAGESEVHRPGGASSRRMRRVERHGAGAPRNGDAHHRALRRLSRAATCGTATSWSMKTTR